MESAIKEVIKVTTSEFNIYEKLLENGFSEEELEKEMQKKAKEFGGFMSKEGILFVIAKENGIDIKSFGIDFENYEGYQNELNNIDYDEFTLNISQLEENMQNVVLLGKIISIIKPKEFIRKDSSVGKVGSFYIIDTTGNVKVVVWNDKTSLMHNEHFIIGQLIRIVGAFTKSTKSGTLEVHLGKRSEIILAPQDVQEQLKQKLNTISREKLELKKQRKNEMQLYDLISRYSYIKKIQGNIKIEDFQEITKKDGEKTFLLKCILSDSSMSMRLIVWGTNAIQMLKLINDGDVVLLTDLVIKENTYTNEKELVFSQKSSLEVL